MQRVGGDAVPVAKRKQIILLVLAAAAFLAVLGWRQATADRAPRGMRVETAPAPDFTLTAHTGEPYQLSADQDRVRVITFGYTHCPDVCPTTLLGFRHAHEQLGLEAEHVRFLFVTVDPGRDTAARLAEYVPRFHPAVLGLTGERSTLQRVWTRYGIYVETRPGDTDGTSHYTVTHTALTYIVDPQGQLRFIHAFGMAAEDLVHDIRLLLREAGISR